MPGGWSRVGCGARVGCDRAISGDGAGAGRRTGAASMTTDGAPTTESFDALAAELIEVCARGVHEPLDDAAFNGLALRVFRAQFEGVPAYRGLCSRRGVTPEAITHWTEVPAVPTRAFKSVPLVSCSVEQTEAEFHTSGTTRGHATRGVHRVRSLALYRASALPNFDAHVLAGLERPASILALMPSVEQAPHSSLSRMLQMALEEWGDATWGFFAEVETGVRFAALASALDRAVAEGRPICLAGTAFAFVHWIDAVDRGDGPAHAVALPAGSRIMETGGFKGRSREVPRGELYDHIARVFGVPTARIVNEYGMTELLSQFYEPVLASDAPAPLEQRAHRAPPWVRTRVLDPESLAPLKPGETGLLCHFDLANLGSVSHVLTEDLGRRTPDGFVVLGRNPGAEPRGCSLTMEDLLR